MFEEFINNFQNCIKLLVDSCRQYQNEIYCNNVKKDC